MNVAIQRTDSGTRERTHMKMKSGRFKLETVMAAAILLAAWTGTSWAGITGDRDHRPQLHLHRQGRPHQHRRRQQHLHVGLCQWRRRSMQYPGPTMIVNQGDVVTVTLNNRLPVPTSIVFPGQKVTASGGTAGLLTQEAPAAVGAVPAVRSPTPSRPPSRERTCTTAARNGTCRARWAWSAR